MKKKKKVSKFRLPFLGFFSIVLIIFFVFTIITNLYNLYSVEKQRNEKENIYLNLQDKTIELKSEITKLQDPDYLARFARENYSYSKKDEIIIKLNKEKEQEKESKEISQNNNKEKIIMILCTMGVFVIIIGTFIRSKKHNKKELSFR